MVVDSSAIVAIILAEPPSANLAARLFAETSKTMAAPNALECHLVLKKVLGQGADRVLDEKLIELGITVVPSGPEHLVAARVAFDRFGKGRHPARLNFGDCIACALAQVSGQPLLFVGDDFAKTDVRVA